MSFTCWIYSKWVPVAVLLVATSCTGRLENKTEVAPGLTYTLLAFESEHTARLNPDYVKLGLWNKGEEIWQGWIVPDSIHPGSAVAQLLPHCTVGDSLRVHMEYPLGIWLPGDTVCCTEFTLKLFQACGGEVPCTPSEMAQILFDDFRNQHSWDLQYPGIAMVWLRESVDSRYRRGQSILFNMDGRALHGALRDTAFAQDFFHVVLGQEYQIIRGIEFALFHMGPDEEVEVVMDADWSFGKPGSKGGEIPPHTPMLYRITTPKTPI